MEKAGKAGLLLLQEILSVLAVEEAHNLRAIVSPYFLLSSVSSSSLVVGAEHTGIEDGWIMMGWMTGGYS